MSEPILTVVIPTYNRPDHLKNLVDLLLPQQDERWKLVIVDNHSTIPAHELVQDPNVVIIRNAANIGAAGNLPRCFEIMDTDWVWMIGDDDLVDSDAIDRVIDAIEQYPDAAVLNFGGHGITAPREKVRSFSSFAEFVAGSDSIFASIWMSGNVYSRCHYWKHIGMAFRFAHCQSSHYVLLIMSLITGGTYIQLRHPVCRQANENLDESGSHSELMFSTMTLAELPMSVRDRHQFARRLEREALRFSRDALQCAFQMEQVDDTTKAEILHLFLARWVNWAVVCGSPSTLLKAAAMRLLLSTTPGRLVLFALNTCKEKITGRSTTRRSYVPRFFRAT